MRKVLIFFSVLLLFGAGCGKKEARQPSFKPLPLNVVAQVNGKNILKSAFDQKLRSLGGAGQNLDQILDLLIAEELIVQNAGKPSSMERASEAGQLIQQIINDQKERIRAKIQVSREDIDAYLQRNEASRFHLLVIVLSDQDKARMVINELNQGADFVTLAKQYSLEREFDLGMVLPGVLDPEVEETVFKLKTYGFSPVVSTGVDYRIFKRVPLNEDFVNAEIKSEKFDQAWEDWLAKLRSSAEIIINSRLFK